MSDPTRKDEPALPRPQSAQLAESFAWWREAWR